VTNTLYRLARGRAIPKGRPERSGGAHSFGGSVETLRAALSEWVMEAAFRE
jgi:hypothetical protein